MRKLFSACFLSFIFFLSHAQGNIPEFGIFSADEIDLKKCSFDEHASAVILLDRAVSNYDEGRLVTSRRIRLKILDDKGKEYGNVRIRFYSGDDFEFIHNIRAISYSDNGNGQYTLNSLSNKSIYTQKEDNYYSSMRFAIPNVKSGSLIDYEYESIKKHYGGLRRWDFQSELPVMKSCYDLEIPPNREFAYQVLKNQAFPVTIRPDNERGRIYFEMKYIPGLRFEPYMDAVRDHLQRVEFQLSGYVNAFGDMQNYLQNWKAVASDLDSDSDFGKAFKKDFAGLDELKIKVRSASNEEQKLSVIYNYTRDHLTWNGYYGIYAMDGLKDVWDKKSGHAGELNLLLVNLLRIFDFEAYPMLVAERDYGKIDTTYPYLEKFNKTVAYVNLSGKYHILDVTEKFIPVNIVPYSLLNTYGFVVDRKNFRLFRITSDKTYNMLVDLQATLDDLGILKGNATMTGMDYARQHFSGKIKKEDKKYVQQLIESNPGIDIEQFSYNELDDFSKPLIQQVSFKHDMNKDGNFVLLNYNLFSGLSKNPFTADIRFTNIDFGYPILINIHEEITIPANATVEIPKNKTLVTPQRNISISREIIKESNVLRIRIRFHQAATSFLKHEYDLVKGFYNEMVTLLNEPVVIKLAK